MTKLQQLQQEMFNLKAEARNIMNREGVTEAEIIEVTNRVTELQAKINLEMQIGEGETIAPQARNGQQLPRAGLDGEDIEPNARYEEAFYNTLRGRATIEDREILEARNLSSGIDEDGGCLIPVDQQTEINELKRTYTPLRTLVTVEPVRTLSGSRVMEKDAEHTPLEKFTEADADGIQETTGPKFVPVSYKIENYGGILPIPRTLLQDQTANLRGYLNRWLAKKAVATENTLIINILKTLTKVPVSTLDDIKDIMDVTLDPSISAISKVVTNQDGFNYLNKLKDSQGNYLLEKDPKAPTKKLLNGREIVVLSNRTLASTGTTEKKAPLIIGSLTDAVVLFDREAIELKSTDVGGDAFKKNRIDMRAIMRLDVKKFDSSAVVFGEIPITGVAAASFQESVEEKVAPKK
ncbi:phage major capsid protein [Cetobacterium somerae]|uniref:phage major capsid protein n=1 Tax=Cetobacterium somerae TaxID=188913 RepID=UPI00211E0308|nr:phage major capsid protein [Cetobacterium somerae]MCQ9627796.1 phage major capsid protein [Cetobacterium somerae]